MKVILLKPALALFIGAALAGCHAPVGADRVSPQAAYQQISMNVLLKGTLSSGTLSTLHRYSLADLAEKEPDEAVRRLHDKFTETRDRNLLFPLAELSFAAGNHIGKSVQPWDTRDPRDFYLGAAVYAYGFLFGDTNTLHQPSEVLDRRFRIAADLYNHGLGLALQERRATDGLVEWSAPRRRLPVGEIALTVSLENFAFPKEAIGQVFLADSYRVRGFSVRNRQDGLGAPLIMVGQVAESLRIRRCAPATMFLRLGNSFEELARGRLAGTLELYSTFDEPSVTIGKLTLPLEADLTVPRAFTLNQSSVWTAGRMEFLTPDLGLKNQLILTEPYSPGRIPVIFVHGTFSSPVWWGEMFNTLEADPEIRKRFQIWMYLYSSSKPIVISGADFREAITQKLAELDPQGKDPALQQMVVVGHSQGGLLAKLTATSTGDKLWQVFNTNRLEDLSISEEQQARVRRLAFFEPLPSVKRVVFIATPHRGSYRAGLFVSNLIRRLVTLPQKLARQGTDFLKVTESSNLPKEMRHRTLTSVDGMSPRNPLMLKLADIPVAPGIHAHSIIAVHRPGDYREGNDGVVKYTSAHLDYAESEFVVRSFHSCQAEPETIEEVRRILHEHLLAYPPPPGLPRPAGPSAQPSAPGSKPSGEGLRP